jgi:guanine deaminase
VPTCTLDLMTQLGALARREGVLVQSHLSETKSEIAWVKELHPTVDPLHMPPPPTHTH